MAQEPRLTLQGAEKLRDLLSWHPDINSHPQDLLLPDSGLPLQFRQALWSRRQRHG